MEPEEKPNRSKTKPLFLQGLCFALCFFAFQLAEFSVNDRTSTLLGANAVNAVYSVGIACTALGLLSFSILRKLCGRGPAEKLRLCAAGVLAAAATAVFLFAQSKAVFAVGACAALFCLGAVGGYVYSASAAAFAGRACAGRALGAGMSCAVLLQFAVQNLLSSNAAVLASIAASLAVIVFAAMRSPSEEDPPPRIKSTSVRGTALRLTAAVVLMSLVVALIDGVVVAKHAEGQLSVSSYARLAYAASLLAAGIVADIKGRKLLPLVTVCMMFLSTVSTVMLGSASTLLFGTLFMYVYCGFYVMYLTISFLDFAPTTNNPALWAPMGRVLRCAVTALTAVPVVKLFASCGSTALVVGSCVLSVAVFLVLLKDIAAVAAPAQKAESKEDSPQAYASHFGLTPRETEAFVLLITTEDGTQEIADSLYISRRVLQRYIASIYEKTNTKSRVGLYQSYAGFIGQKGEADGKK